MKKVLLIIALFCSIISAQPTDSDFSQWPRSYFASIGFDVIATRGDFFKRTLRIQNKDGLEETINFPTSKVYMSPEYSIGVNIREFSLATSFQYWSMQTPVTNIPEEQKMRFWRLGVDFVYYFFYPEFFQAGAGIGYSYSSIKTENSAISSQGREHAELMGSAISLIGNIRYYVTSFFCLNPSMHIYEGWYRAVNTRNSGTIELNKKNNGIKDKNSYVWQTNISISISAMVQF